MSLCNRNLCKPCKRLWPDNFLLDSAQTSTGQETGWPDSYTSIQYNITIIVYITG